MLRGTIAIIKTMSYSTHMATAKGSTGTHTTLGVGNIKVLGQLEENIERVEKTGDISAELPEELWPVQVKSLEPERTQPQYQLGI